MIGKSYQKIDNALKKLPEFRQFTKKVTRNQTNDLKSYQKLDNDLKSKNQTMTEKVQQIRK